MRTIESLILITLFLSIIPPFFNVFKRPKWTHFLPSATIVLIIFHVLAESYRWQMVPAYVLSILIFIFTLTNLKMVIAPQRNEGVQKLRWIRIIGATLILLLCIFSVSIPVLIPVMALPKPTGPYAIGTQYFRFIDGNTLESSMLKAPENREIVAQVWYPANPMPDAKPEPYWDNARALSAICTKRLALFMEMLSIKLNNRAMLWFTLPSYGYSHNALTKTYSYRDAPIVKDVSSFPVVIYSHGIYFMGNKESIALMEALATHGYIVCAIAHAYDAPFYIYPDKTIKSFDGRNGLLIKQLETAYFDEHVTTLMRNLKKSKNPSEQRVLLNELNSKVTSWQQGARERVADVQFLIDELETMNEGNGMFAEKLGLERLGVLGFSYGGLTTSQLCLVDQRCKAGISMDGPAPSNMLDFNLTQPFMFMYSKANHRMSDFFYQKAENAAYQLTIAGTAHLNFTDMSLIGGYTKFTQQIGPINGNHCTKIINDYVLAFFDKHLKGNDSGLLDGPFQKYPEVEFVSRNS